MKGHVRDSLVPDGTLKQSSDPKKLYLDVSGDVIISSWFRGCVLKISRIMVDYISPLDHPGMFLLHQYSRNSDYFSASDSLD